MNSQQIEIMAKKLKAIANAKRLKILYHIIDDEELSVGRIEKLVELSQSALSQHLAVLREENIVKTRRSAQTIYYSIKDEKIMGMFCHADGHDFVGFGIFGTKPGHGIS